MPADRINAAVGAVIKAEREKIGASQKDLGAVIGVKRSQEQKYEGGVSPVPAHSLLLLAKHFGIPVAAFFAAVDKMAAAEASAALKLRKRVRAKARKAVR